MGPRAARVPSTCNLHPGVRESLTSLSHAQIILLQTVHYLALCVLTPFAAGGAPGVGLVMDWRELAGRVAGDAAHGGGTAYVGAKALAGENVRILGSVQDVPGAHAWGLATCWMVAALFEYVRDMSRYVARRFGLKLTRFLSLWRSVWAIYVFVRRPRLVLDFALTLAGAHVVLTTYYAGAVPRGLFTWVTYAAACGATVVLGEQLCVRREMADGIPINSREPEDVELGALPAHEMQS